MTAVRRLSSIYEGATNPFLMPEYVLRCPGCGAPAAADAAACGYCGSALATVTCPACFAAMFAGSRFCARCGAEATREQLDAKPLPCPRCKREEMQSLKLGTTTVHECGACGGLWLDPRSLQHLCDTREEHSSVVGALATRVPTSGAPLETIKYLPCPVCTKLMNRVNFAHSSGVIVDVCKTDGVWLDRGELNRVIDFVEAGGMTVSRQREREKLVDEQRRLAMMQSFSPSGSARSTGSMFMVQGSILTNDQSSATGFDRLVLDALGLFLK